MSITTSGKLRTDSDKEFISRRLHVKVREKRTEREDARSSVARSKTDAYGSSRTALYLAHRARGPGITTRREVGTAERWGPMQTGVGITDGGRKKGV